jgi:hypothetical protein
MAEQESESFDDIFRNKLKAVDVRTLEQTIAKAVGDLIGVQLNCSIDNVEYRASYARTSAKFNVSLSEPLNFDFGSGKSKESS